MMHSNSSSVAPRSRSWQPGIQAWLDPAASRPRHEVIAAMLTDAPPQKGPRFSQMLLELRSRLQSVAGTTNEVVFVPGGGTVALEAAIANFLIPDGHAIALVNGVFGERIAQIMEAFGQHVHRVTAPWGQPITIEQVDAALCNCPQASAISIVHTESSTGVANPVEAIALAVRQVRPELPVIVDAVPSVGAEYLNIDSAGLDVVAFTSGKALGGPVGCCGCLFIAERMWQRMNNGIPRYSLDLREIARAARDGAWLRAAPVHALMGFAEAVRLVQEEGRHRVVRRHQEIATLTRDSLRRLGLELVANDDVAARTVTVGFVPRRIAGTQLVKRLTDQFGVVIGAGRDEWTDRTIRIGHMGWVSRDEIELAMDALRRCLKG